MILAKAPVAVVLTIVLALSAVAQESEAEFAALLEKETPTALPQSPVAKRKGSDTSDEGLKGKVKVVRVEKEYLDGTGYPSGKRLYTLKEFNSNGNLVRQVFTDYRGNLSFVVVYGYLLGKRVSKASTSVRRSYDPPPIRAVPFSTPPALEKKPDERYTSSWEYKYDSDRLIEELQSNNRGELINKTTYSYTPNQVVEIFCSLPCKTLFVETTTLDEKGNVIKSVNDNGMTTRPIDSEYDYKYLSFDEKGNWLKREITGRISTTPTTDKPIHYIESRTITYF